MKYIFLKLFFLNFLLFISVSCKNEQSTNKHNLDVKIASSTLVVSQPSSSVVSATITEKTTPLKDWLAKLIQQSNQVEYRQRNQNIWQKTDGEATFMKYDALQTKNASTAQVTYQSGSVLDVKENTLIIFDEDPGRTKKTEDRVIIKSGQLTGKTKTELWVFTNSGLVQIKNKKGSGKSAETKVTIEKDKSVNIDVKSGIAEIVYKNDNDYTRTLVSQNNQINLKPNTELTKGMQVDNEKIQELTRAMAKVTTHIQSDIAVEFPNDNTLVRESNLEVRGKVTGIGSKLLINGQLAELSESGQFKKTISLQTGTSLIIFQLIRSDASVKFVKRNVRYQPQ